MDKLNRIQKVFKVFKVLSMVVGIIALAAGVTAVVCGILLAMGNQSEPLLIVKIGGTAIYLPIFFSGNDSSFTNLEFCGKCMSEGILYIFEGLIYLRVFRYLSLEQKEGTPFTSKGAKALRNLGIVNIVLSVVGIAIAEAAAELCGISEMVNGTNASMVFTGIVFIIGSLIFDYGASLNNNDNEIGEKKDELT